jgi:hypothetical protein
VPDNSSVLNLLRADLERAGFYPQLVADGVASLLGGEAVVDYLVHHETTFDSELRRHLSVLVLTPTRLIFGHTDDHPDQSDGHGHATTPYATTTTEAVPLRNVRSVTISRVVGDPAQYGGEPSVSEVVISIAWGTISQVDLEPAVCDNPECDADHGYTGTLRADDFVLRVTEVAEGTELVRRAQAFAATVSAVTAGASG